MKSVWQGKHQRRQSQIHGDDDDDDGLSLSLLYFCKCSNLSFSLSHCFSSFPDHHKAFELVETILGFCFCFGFGFYFLCSPSSHFRLRWRHPRIRALAPSSLQRCFCSLQCPLLAFAPPSQLGLRLLRRAPESYRWWQTQNAMVFLSQFSFFFSVLENSFGFLDWIRIFFLVWLVGFWKWSRYFKEHGWPSSTIFESPPENDEDRAKLIDTLQVLYFFIFPLFGCLENVRRKIVEDVNLRVFFWGNTIAVS